MGKRHGFTPIRCPHCGHNFMARHPDQRFCGRACKHAYKYPNDKTAPAYGRGRSTEK